MRDAHRKEYAEHMNRLRRNRLDGVEAKRAELAKLERDRVKLLEAIKAGMPADLLREDGERISTRMEVLKHELANVEEPAPILHPAMADVYAREIQRLRETLNEEAHREEAAALIRGLIERIVLRLSEDGSRLVVDLEGDLAGILAVAVGEARKETDVGEGSVVALEAAEAVAARRFRLPAAQAAAGGRNRWLREGEFVYSSVVVGIGGCGGPVSPIPREDGVSEEVSSSQSVRDLHLLFNAYDVCAWRYDLEAGRAGRKSPKAGKAACDEDAPSPEPSQ